MTAIEKLRPTGLVNSPIFSHVALVPPGATWVLVGGQNGVDESGAVVSDNAAEQTARALDNVETALAAAGAGLSDAVTFTVTLSEGVDVRAAYGAIAGRLNEAFEVPPLVSVAIVSALAVPGAVVEIAVTAAVMP